VGLLERLSSPQLGVDERVSVLEAVQTILIQAGDEAIASNVLWALASDSTQEASVRVAASRALLATGNQDFTRVIERKLKHSNARTAAGAARALGKARRRESVEALIELAASTAYEMVCGEAVWALGEIGDSRAIGIVQRALDGGRCRRVAIEALGKLGGLSSLQNIVVYLGHEEHELRLVSAKALERLFVRHRRAGLENVVARILDRLMVETDADINVVLTGCLRIVGAPVPQHVTGRILNASLGRINAAQMRTRKS